MELVNAREQAASEREDKILKLAREAEKESTTWEPSRDLSLGPHPVCQVPALSDSCMATLTAHIACVASLEGVPDAIRVKLATAVCSGRKMSAEAAAIFAGGGARDVVLSDCTQLDAAAMLNVVQLCVSPVLERLELISCGRGFGDEAAAVMLKAGPLLLLDSLVLGGAYRLSDQGLLQALQAAPSLTILSLPHASRLSGQHIRRLPTLLPNLRRLNLQGCQGVDKETLMAALPRMTALCCLTLDKIAEVDDAVMSAAGTAPSLHSATSDQHPSRSYTRTHCVQVDDAVMSAAGTAPSLHSLSINLCQLVTDRGVAALAASRPQLQQLQMDDCLKITDAALLSLHSSCNGLRLLSLRRCAKLTDAGLAGLVAHGSLTTLVTNGVPAVGSATMRALAQSCHELQCLDVSFCRHVHDSALGLVADSCPALRRVVCFGCSQISKAFFHGHSNPNLVGNIHGTGSSCV
ncbi:MAG: hypothetical protein WDW36_002189 [Sanguina aurantia]